MSIKQQVMDQIKAAMKAKQMDRLKVLRMISAEIKQKEVDDRIELTDNDVLTIFNRMSKQRKDSISQYEAADREDLAAIEKAELEVIAEFLPKALSEVEIDELIDSAVNEVGAATMADMGKVMGILKPQIVGRADMAAVSGKIKAKLS
ncbi:GatB/YqeY domain-containing protein [Salinibius halmophilus]|uniref:GatB/YqeY domain-containing protein n=1 Tax=Salinibius halmophilus TaxID=1853216 RepID=UPI000E671327|nr:GatB/YqeY domain-containing protein [Salinibius halmophilus]